MEPAVPALAHLRVVLAPGVEIGPGKADLLEAIAETGSISAAGRRMGMSYRRAWQLVETLNDGFREPLVIASRGGNAGGGAALTDAGRTVLEAYREMQRKTARVISGEIASLRALTSDIPDET
ncbi:MAG: LysR family transcriptional regulator [Pseudomonadota bacterium]|nr:LysR family transcriptional regulator [Pseudomonadota bacterium]